MASSIIGALRAVLGLDTAQFESGADRAKAKAGGLKAALMSTASSLAPLVSGAALATVAVNGFAVGMRLAAEAAAFADDLAAQSYKLGVSAEYLQSFNFAAGESDVPVDKAADALMGLSAAIGALQSGIGDGKIRKAMEALGISQAQIDSFKSVEDALPVIADKISQLGTVTEQLQFAKKFGIEALLPLLKQGSAGIEEMMQKSRDLGMVLGDEVITRLADMSREMEIADERSRLAGLSFGANFTPALVAMKNAAADAVNWLASFVDQFNRLEDRSEATLRKQVENAKAWRKFYNEKGNEGAAAKEFAREVEATEMLMRLDAAKKAAERKGRPSAGELPEPLRPTASTSSGRSRSSPGGGRAEESWAEMFGRVKEDANRVRDEEFAKAFAKTVIDPKSLQEPVGTAVLQGIQDRMADVRAEFSDAIYNATRNGLDALRYGGLKGFTNFLADSFARAMNDRIAQSVAGLFDGKSAGGGTMSFLRSLAGFDTGGSFQVGGVGGTDSQLRMLRLSPGENVSITRGNDGGGRGTQIFQINAQGAVLAEGLIAEMQSIGMQAAVGGATGGASLVEQRLARRGRHSFR